MAHQEMMSNNSRDQGVSNLLTRILSGLGARLIAYSLVEANVAVILEDEAPRECLYEFEFVSGQIRALSGGFRHGLLTALLFFDLFVPFHVTPFHRQTLARRVLILRRFHSWHIPVIRELMMFFRSLTVFAHYANDMRRHHDD